MAGVSGPMMRDRRGGVAFLGGLLGGELAAALILGIGAYLLGTAIAAILVWQVRVVIIGVAGLGLAVADFAGRTPQIRRQVPQRMARSGLSPMLLGGVWGFDLGLVFTTKKAASLGWFALVAVTVFAPRLAPLMCVVMASSSVVAIVVWSLMVARPRTERGWSTWHGTRLNWLTAIRALSAVTMLTVAVVITAHDVALWSS